MSAPDDAPLEPKFWELAAVVGAVVGVLAIASLVIGAIALAVSGGTASDPKALRTVVRSQPVTIGFMLAATLGMIAAVYFCVIFRRRMTWRTFGFRSISAKLVLISLALGVLAIPLMGVAAIGTQMLLDRPRANPQIGMLAPGGFSWIAMVATVVIGGLLVPIAEEILFRGLLFRWLRRHVAMIGAAVLSGLLFGLVHGFIEVIVAASLLGMALAMVYEWTRSLWPPVIIHATNNTIVITAMFLTLK